MSHSLTLYHYWRSSCSWRVRWALNLKGLPYNSIPVNLLKGEHKTPSYTALNPSQTVPTLITAEGKPLTESMAILEWLDELYPTAPLLPADSYSRAKVRELALVIVAGTQPIQNLKVQQYIAQDQAARAQFAQHWIQEGLKAYETRIANTAGTYSFGGQVTMADLCLVPQCYNAERFGVALQNFPNIHRIYQTCLKTPACEEAAPQNQPGAMPEKP